MTAQVFFLYKIGFDVYVSPRCHLRNAVVSVALNVFHALTITVSELYDNTIWEVRKSHMSKQVLEYYITTTCHT